jgi:thiosulfate/3-mercaptopyruvate sulfurtransferase
MRVHNRNQALPMHATIIEPADLVPCSPDWAVVDCRFDLARPEWGSDAYAAGHIPCAVYAHLDRDLSGPVTPQSGRHPLPEISVFARALSNWGIDDGVQVVAYDQGNGAYAARLWWMLRWLGHKNVVVLNGGFAAWQRAGLTTSTEQPVVQPRQFIARPAQWAVVSTSELARWVADGKLEHGAQTLLDARGTDRFAGENETIDPVAGHIPGARSAPFARNLDEQGRFLPAAVLRDRWAEILRGQPPARVILMCGSGVTACHNLLALEMAGLPGARLYAGSWSEWIRDASRPVAAGPRNCNSRGA